MQRKFACSEPDCDARFSRNEHLKRHMVTHTGARPFVCQSPDCSYRTGNKQHLLRHQRLHADPTPHACPVAGCTERFAKVRKLREHQLLHAGPLPFVCCSITIRDSVNVKCGAAFGSKAELEKHERVSHGMERDHIVCRSDVYIG